MACECAGLRGLDLAVCLAPPEGEYEAVIPISDNISIIVNRKGIFIKRIVTDDMLPFVRTVLRKITREETLQAYGVSLDRILCAATRSLIDASRHGSTYAARRVEECNELVQNIASSCSN
ncbi:MAG: hypothetical protein F7C34_03170 [Desulfurococcales archaeon]|nr:hypothetical protein [Desulfurococcales archaeon]